MIKSAYLMPHAPILLVEDNSINKGLLEISKRVSEEKPKIILLITPHGPVFSDGLAINYQKNLKGDLSAFDIEYSLEKENDLTLVDRIVEALSKINIPMLKLNDENCEYFEISSRLDHGTLVPLSFIEKNYTEYKLIHITYGLFSSDMLYKIGMEIEKVITEDAIIIASGDLAHKEEDNEKEGLYFDMDFRNLLNQDKVLDIIFYSHEIRYKARECGKRSMDIMLGMLDSYNRKIIDHGYDNSYGVGYLALSYTELEKTNTSFIKEIEKTRFIERKIKIEKESKYQSIARNELLKHFGKNVSDFKREGYKAGTFVSLYKDGGLRGCIGTIGATQDDVVDEIKFNALKAAFEDPRFEELSFDELFDLDISVDIIKNIKEVSKEELDPIKYGIIVSKDYKRGVLLPDLEGIKTVDEQIRIAKHKGSIEGDDFIIERFEVERYK